MSKIVSEDDKKLAKFIDKIFAGKSKAFEYWDEKEKNSISILSSQDPNDNLTSYSTIGFSNYINLNPTNGSDIRCEVLAINADANQYFPNILASLVFYILQRNVFCHPRLVIPNILNLYNFDSQMQHLLITNPFIWEDKLVNLQLKDKKVHWLLAIPISESELVYAETKGVEELETLMEKSQIDISQLYRKSILGLTQN